MRVLLFACLLASTLTAAEPTVLCYGDSITFASWKEQGVGDGNRWVDLLAKQGLRTVNAGKNGRVTGDAKGLAAALQATPNPDLVVIMLGVNDLKDIRDPEATVRACAANIAALIDTVKQTAPQANVLVCSPIRINPATLTDYWTGKGFGQATQQCLEALPAAYAGVATAKGVRFTSLLDAVTPAHLPDGVHPNAAGHAEIAQALMQVLRTK